MHKNVCGNYDYCYVEMPEEDNKILKYNHGEKSMKKLFFRLKRTYKKIMNYEK